MRASSESHPVIRLTFGRFDLYFLSFNHKLDHIRMTENINNWFWNGALCTSHFVIVHANLKMISGFVNPQVLTIAADSTATVEA
jgi:uncharacterized membrane protein YdcZ (DUF606 family)